MLIAHPASFDHQFMPEPIFRNPAVKCLTEIGSIRIGEEYDSHFGVLLRYIMQRLVTIIPPNAGELLSVLNRSPYRELNNYHFL